MSEILPIAIAAIGSSALTAIINAFMNRRKTHADTRQSNANADSVMAHTSSDLLTMVRSVYEERMEDYEERIVELEEKSKSDHNIIVKLNQDVGKLRQAGEAQGERILYLEGQVAIWKGYAKELIALLRSKGIPLPKWAEAINAR